MCINLTMYKLAQRLSDMVGTFPSAREAALLLLLIALNMKVNHCRLLDYWENTLLEITAPERKRK